MTAELFPAVLDRAATPAEARRWGDQVVRGTPIAEAVALAESSESRRHQVALAYDTAFGRVAAPSERDGWAGQLAGAWSHDRLLSHLFASEEQTRRTPGAAQWVDWTFGRLLGRAPDAASRTHFTDQLARGASRATVARGLIGSTEARRRQATLTLTEVLGRSPSAEEQAFAETVLRQSGGDVMALRAVTTAGAEAPAGHLVGVAGDSIGFDLAFRANNQPLPTVVAGGRQPTTGAVIGCGVLSPLGWRWRNANGHWQLAAGGVCPASVASHEQTMLDRGVRVVVWPIGAWEWSDVMRPGGEVVPARSPAMREALASAMVTRIDAWTAGSVRKVVLPEWACPGPEAPDHLRRPDQRRFIRSVLDEVVRRRPKVAVIPATPPQVCVGGDPEAAPTREHRVARRQQFHWGDGPDGAAWGWRNWFAPAIADLPGLR